MSNRQVSHGCYCPNESSEHTNIMRGLSKCRPISRPDKKSHITERCKAVNKTTQFPWDDQSELSGIHLSDSPTQMSFSVDIGRRQSTSIEGRGAGAAPRVELWHKHNPPAGNWELSSDAVIVFAVCDSWTCLVTIAKRVLKFFLCFWSALARSLMFFWCFFFFNPILRSASSLIATKGSCVPS